MIPSPQMSPQASTSATAGSPEPSCTKASTDQLYEAVTDRVSYYIIDGRAYRTYTLPQKDRNHFMPKVLRQHLQKTKRNWGITEFRTTIKELKKKDCAPLMEAAEREKPAPFTSMQLTPEMRENPTLISGFHWQYDATTNNDCIELPDLETAVPNQRLSLLNGDKEKTLTIKGVKKENKLEPGEAAFFTCRAYKHRKIWGQTGSYAHVCTQIKTNPLLRDFGPRVSDKSGLSHGGTPSDGELFLPIDVVQDLATMQSPDKQTRYPLFTLDQDNPDFIRQVQAQLTSASSGCSVLIHNPGSEHILAARLIRRGNELICYLHEPLKQTTKQAVVIQEQVCTTLLAAFPGLSIRCLVPEAALQHDFYSCGVYALKALRAFRKTDKFDYTIFSAGIKSLPVARISQKAGKSGEEDSRKDKLLVMPERLPLQNIPPRLLKMYQGSSADLSKEKQLSVAVCKDGTTLEQYYEKHSREKCLHDKTDKHMVKLAPFGKRYLYASEWHDAQSRPEEKPAYAPAHILIPYSAPPVRVVSTKRPHTETPESDVKPGNPVKKQKLEQLEKLEKLKKSSVFARTFNATSTKEVNDRLAELGYNDFQVTEHDFRMSCEFEAFVLNRRASFSDHKAHELAEWLAPLVKDNIEVGSKEHLLKDWCLLALKSDTTWHKRSLKFAQNKLKEYIKALDKIDRIHWRNCSDSSDELPVDTQADSDGETLCKAEKIPCRAVQDLS